MEHNLPSNDLDGCFHLSTKAIVTSEAKGLHRFLSDFICHVLLAVSVWCLDSTLNEGPLPGHQRLKPLESAVVEPLVTCKSPKID